MLPGYFKTVSAVERKMFTKIVMAVNVLALFTSVVASENSFVQWYGYNVTARPHMLEKMALRSLVDCSISLPQGRMKAVSMYLHSKATEATRVRIQVWQPLQSSPHSYTLVYEYPLHLPAASGLHEFDIPSAPVFDGNSCLGWTYEQSDGPIAFSTDVDHRLQFRYLHEDYPRVGRTYMFEKLAFPVVHSIAVGIVPEDVMISNTEGVIAGYKQTKHLKSQGSASEGVMTENGTDEHIITENWTTGSILFAANETHGDMIEHIMINRTASKGIIAKRNVTGSIVVDGSNNKEDIVTEDSGTENAEDEDLSTKHVLVKIPGLDDTRVDEDPGIESVVTEDPGAEDVMTETPGTKHVLIKIPGLEGRKGDGDPGDVVTQDPGAELVEDEKLGIEHVLVTIPGLEDIKVANNPEAVQPTKIVHPGDGGAERNPLLYILLYILCGVAGLAVIVAIAVIVVVKRKRRLRGATRPRSQENSDIGCTSPDPNPCPQSVDGQVRGTPQQQPEG